MVELAQAVQARDFEQAQAIHVEIMTNKMDECGNWMVSLAQFLDDRAVEHAGICLIDLLID